jgi:adhesin/invasin
MRPAVVRRSRLLAPLLVLLAAAIAAGCSDQSAIGPKKVVAVRITPDTVRLVVGGVDTVKGFAIDQSGAYVANKDVQWSTSDASIATVDAQGLVTGVALGQVDLTGSIGEISQTVRALVTPTPAIAVSVDTVELTAIAGSGTEPSSTVAVTNGGGGLLTDLLLGPTTYSGAATGWASADLDQPAAPATLNVLATPGVLPVGTYYATVPILSDDSPNSPLGVVVQLVLTADVASTMALDAGDNQNVAAGTVVSILPSVRVSDQFGNPVAGAVVTFAVAGGGGSITGGAAPSNVDGIATVGSWTLGGSIGPNSLTATAAGLTGSPITFIASGVAGAASQIAIDGGNGQTVVAGQPVPVAPSAIVRDAFNNPVSGVSVTFAVATGGGQITGGAQTTNASGIATIGSWTTGTTAGANSLSITSTGLTGSPLTVTATGTPGTASAVAINAGNSQSAPAGTNVAVAPSAQVTDINGNGVPGVAVTFQVTAGGGSIAGGAPVTNASGIATITSWTLGSTVGANSLSATAPGLTGSPLTFTATGVTGAAATMAVNAGDNAAASAGSQVAVPPAVLVTDAFGNPVSGVSVTFAVASGGGSLTGGGQTTNASGIAAVTSWTLGAVAGVNTLTATSTGLTGSPITFTATGNPGNATNLALVQGDGQTGSVGGTLGTTLQVLVTDNLANPVQGVTVGWATASGSLVPASSVTNASGIATTSWTLGTTPGAVTATGSVGGLTGSPVTFSATANPGAPANITIVQGNGQSATVNTALATAPAVRISDVFNNPLSGVSVTFAVTTGGGSATGTSQSTNASGIATLTSWTLGTVAGSNTLSATATGPGAIGFSATGTAGAATSIAVSAGNALSATVGTATATAPRVLVRDAFNNPVANVNVVFAITGGGGSITGGNQFTNASGLAAATSWTLGTTAGANSVSATSAGLTGSPLGFSATGTPGAVTSIIANGIFPTSATVNTALGTDPSVIARDQYNNTVPSVAILFTKSATNGSVDCGAGGLTSCSVTTNASGVATVTSWILGTVAGTSNNTLTASRVGSSSLVFTASASAGAVSSISTNSTNPQTARPGAGVTAPSAVARDQFSNVVPSVAITFTVTAGGGSINCGLGSTTACNATTNASGVASLTSWVVSNGGSPSNGTYANTVSATRTGSTSATFTTTARYTFASDIQPLWTAFGCAGCHPSPYAPNPSSLGTMRGVAAIYACTNLNRIQTGTGGSNAGSSALYWRLANNSTCGIQMPQGGPYLSAGQLAVVRDWINNNSDQ